MVTMADRIVDAIEHDLNDRSGLGIDCLDADIQEEIRAKWRSLVTSVLEGCNCPVSEATRARHCLALYHVTRDMLYHLKGHSNPPSRVVRSAKAYAEMVGCVWPDDFVPPLRDGEEPD